MVHPPRASFPPLTQAGLNEEEARFYIACVVLGLESMHELGLLHRSVGRSEGDPPLVSIMLWYISVPCSDSRSLSMPTT